MSASAVKMLLVLLATLLTLNAEAQAPAQPTCIASVGAPAIPSIVMRCNSVPRSMHHSAGKGELFHASETPANSVWAAVGEARSAASHASPSHSCDGLWEARSSMQVRQPLVLDSLTVLVNLSVGINAGVALPRIILTACPPQADTSKQCGYTSPSPATQPSERAGNGRLSNPTGSSNSGRNVPADCEGSMEVLLQGAEDEQGKTLSNCDHSSKATTAATITGNANGVQTLCLVYNDDIDLTPSSESGSEDSSTAASPTDITGSSLFKAKSTTATDTGGQSVSQQRLRPVQPLSQLTSQRYRDGSSSGGGGGYGQNGARDSRSSVFSGVGGGSVGSWTLTLSTLVPCSTASAITAADDSDAVPPPLPPPSDQDEPPYRITSWELRLCGRQVPLANRLAEVLQAGRVRQALVQRVQEMSLSSSSTQTPLKPDHIQTPANRQDGDTSSVFRANYAASPQQDMSSSGPIADTAAAAMAQSGQTLSQTGHRLDLPGLPIGWRQVLKQQLARLRAVDRMVSVDSGVRDGSDNTPDVNVEVERKLGLPEVVQRAALCYRNLNLCYEKYVRVTLAEVVDEGAGGGSSDSQMGVTEAGASSEDVDGGGGRGGFRRGAGLAGSGVWRQSRGYNKWLKTFQGTVRQSYGRRIKQIAGRYTDLEQQIRESLDTFREANPQLQEQAELIRRTFNARLYASAYSSAAVAYASAYLDAIIGLALYGKNAELAINPRYIITRLLLIIIDGALGTSLIGATQGTFTPDPTVVGGPIVPEAFNNVIDNIVFGDPLIGPWALLRAAANITASRPNGASQNISNSTHHDGNGTSNISKGTHDKDGRDSRDSNQASTAIDDITHTNAHALDSNDGTQSRTAVPTMQAVRPGSAAMVSRESDSKGAASGGDGDGSGSVGLRWRRGVLPGASGLYPWLDVGEAMLAAIRESLPLAGTSPMDTLIAGNDSRPASGNRGDGNNASQHGVGLGWRKTNAQHEGQRSDTRGTGNGSAKARATRQAALQTFRSGVFRLLESVQAEIARRQNVTTSVLDMREASLELAAARMADGGGPGPLGQTGLAVANRMANASANRLLSGWNRLQAAFNQLPLARGPETISDGTKYSQSGSSHMADVLLDAVRAGKSAFGLQGSSFDGRLRAFLTSRLPTPTQQLVVPEVVKPTEKSEQEGSKSDAPTSPQDDNDDGGKQGRDVLVVENGREIRIMDAALQDGGAPSERLDRGVGRPHNGDERPEVWRSGARWAPPTSGSSEPPLAAAQQGGSGEGVTGADGDPGGREYGSSITTNGAATSHEDLPEIWPSSFPSPSIEGLVDRAMTRKPQGTTTASSSGGSSKLKHGRPPTAAELPVAWPHQVLPSDKSSKPSMSSSVVQLPITVLSAPTRHGERDGTGFSEDNHATEGEVDEDVLPLVWDSLFEP